MEGGKVGENWIKCVLKFYNTELGEEQGKLYTEALLEEKQCMCVTEGAAANIIVIRVTLIKGEEKADIINKLL